MAEFKRINSRVSGNDCELITSWVYEESGDKYSINVREFYSDWGETHQVAIQKNYLRKFVFKENDVSVEPSMKEKVFILRGINLFSVHQLCFEVFPVHNNIVDNLDMYHIWVIEKSSFPYFVTAKIPSMRLGWKNVTIFQRTYSYRVRLMNNGIKIYYLRAVNGEELRWWEKQDFKDNIIGSDIVAVELMKNSRYDISILICMPENVKKLPFGLKERQGDIETEKCF